MLSERPFYFTMYEKRKGKRREGGREREDEVIL